jgi:hypothetical protein
MLEVVVTLHNQLYNSRIVLLFPTGAGNVSLLHTDPGRNQDPSWWVTGRLILPPVAKPLGCERDHSHPLSIRGATLPRPNTNSPT